MNSVRLLIGLGALIALTTGCAGEVATSTADDPAVAFENLTVAQNFTFATRQEVRLRLQATDPGVAKYIEVSDDEGRRLFAGAVRGDLDLDFDVRKSAEPVLNLRVGRGAEAVTHTVDLASGLASASY